MRSLLLAAAIVLCAQPPSADSCGAFIARTDGLRFNDALQFVIARDGTRTTLSVQNKYRGPSEDFALLVPVPVVLREGDVKTLDPKVFDAFESVTAPLLTTMRERDPCERMTDYDGVGAAAPGGAQRGAVTIESQFAVGEYEITMLSATESTALDAWLHENGYALPKNLESRLRPYIEEGSKFFVAKVDPSKLKIVDGAAVLSPLRFEYDAPDVRLPIRLSAASSAGVQDVLVYALRPNDSSAARMEAANRPNVMMPSDIEITEAAANDFAGFYASLFAHVQRTQPSAVVTEFVGPTWMSAEALAAVGAPSSSRSWTVSRLHLQISRDGPLDDLILRDAAPANVRAAFLRKIPWTGPVSCNRPRRGHWSGSAPDIAHRTALATATPIDQLVVSDLPTLSIKSVVPKPAPPDDAGGCTTSGHVWFFVLVGVFVLRVVMRRYFTRS